VSLPLGHYRSIAKPHRLVEAVYYAKDGHNVEDVRAFLEARHTSAWGGPHTRMGGPRYETICFDDTPGSTLYIHPGYLVYVYADTLKTIATTYDAFHQYFTKDPMPVVMNHSQTYKRSSSPSRVDAIQYVAGYNERAVDELLKYYGHTVASLHSDSSRVFRFRPAKDKVAVSGLPSTDTEFPIEDGTWVTVTTIPDDLPLLKLYADNEFHAFLTPHHFEEQDTPVTEPTESTEYDQNRTAVLDSLAYLRASTSDQMFELVTNELMGLLADAFNEGWSKGVEHSQVNPYVDWA
jgi:hypothetical protein